LATIALSGQANEVFLLLNNCKSEAKDLQKKPLIYLFFGYLRKNCSIFFTSPNRPQKASGLMEFYNFKLGRESAFLKFDF
jgi:hypothetical protein